MSETLKVLYLASEVVPLAKSGGLADVAGALPAALKGLGVDIRLVLPYYREVQEKNAPVKLLFQDLEVPLGGQRLTANIFETEIQNHVTVYLIERADLYDRPKLYGDGWNDYHDNLERFSFYCHAVLSLLEAIQFRPDLIHGNDWQTGLVPALIKAGRGGGAAPAGTPVIFTVHNIGYQGLFPGDKFPLTGLSGQDFFHPDGLEYWGNISLLKAGIVYAQTVTTVSPTYAREIQTAEYGRGMEGILRKKNPRLYGILNGVDYQRWNPAHDPVLAANYSLENPGGKRQCKEFLLNLMKLDPGLVNRPLVGMTSRFDEQKGFDLLLACADEILSLDVGLVILGTGDEPIQRELLKIAGRHPGRMAVETGFDEVLAHRILAGADIFLIPSRYEPCGLTQMYALKYGTVPVVRATGGLDDSIIGFDGRSGKGTGFKFNEYQASALLDCFRRALKAYEDILVWAQIIRNGMEADFSWDRSARSYRDLYQLAVEERAV